MATWLTPEDLTPFTEIPTDQATAMISQAEGLAKVLAPCLTGELSDDQLDALRGILVTAILRWEEAGHGALTQASSGSFSGSVDPRVRRGQFWPSEIKSLQRICRPESGKAFMVDMTQPQPASSMFDLRPDLRFQFE